MQRICHRGYKYGYEAEEWNALALKLIAVSKEFCLVCQLTVDGFPNKGFPHYPTK